MLKRLFTSFVPPVRSALALERLQTNLRAMLLILIVASALAFLFNNGIETRLGSGLLFLVMLFLLLFFTNGDLAFARVATPLIVFAVLIYFLLTGTGLQGGATHGLLVVLLLARLLGSGATTFVYLVLSMIALAIAYQMEMMGLLEGGDSRSDLADLLNLYTVYVAVAASVWLLAKDDEDGAGVPAAIRRPTAGLAQGTGHEDRYRLLADNVTDFIWTADLDLKYTYCSPSSERITGYQPDELVGVSIFAILTSEESAASFVDIFNREMQREKNAPGIGQHTSAEVELRRKDGTTTWVEAQLSFLRDDSAKVIGIVGTTRDINARIEAETVAKEVAEQLRQAQKIDSIGQLAGGIAHDFNNMLVAIQGYSDLAANHESTPDEVKQFVSEIRKAALRAENLTRQLLTFSRRQAMDRKPVSLNTLLLDQQHVLSRLIPANVTILLDLAPDSFEISGDVGQLEQLVVNLFVNARDAMPGGGTATISTSNLTLDEQDASRLPNATAGDYVRLSVADTGIGMEPELLRRVFEPFFTTKRQGHGTGLGLSVVHGIVIEHGGFITMESVEGEGTTVHAHFPRSASSRSPEMTPEGKEGGNETILLVEDEEQVRELARIMLTQAGYSVLTAGDGQFGLELFKQERGQIALVVSDVVMPNMGGRELLARVREIDQAVPFIFISGYVGGPDPRNFVEQHEVTFLQKPFSAIALQQAVRDSIDNHSPGSIRQQLLLAIDDNEALLHLLELDIKELGHRIMTASDSDRGLRLTGRHDFDVIFIDLDMMPVNGIELTRTLKQRGNTARIYGLTTRLTSDEKNRCVAAGMNDLILKPVSKESLNRILGGKSRKSTMATPSQESVPLFDMALSLDLANNRVEVAETMLNMLIGKLPEHLQGIHDAFEDRDLDTLIGRIEKLVGTIRYCGVPALAEVAKRLEVTGRGSNTNDIEESITMLEERINELLSWHRSNPDPWGQPQRHA